MVQIIENEKEFSNIKNLLITNDLSLLKKIIIFDIKQLLQNKKSFDLNELIEEIIDFSKGYLAIALISFYEMNEVFQNIDEANEYLDKVCQENNFIYLDYDYFLKNNNYKMLDEYISERLNLEAEYSFFTKYYKQNQKEIKYIKWFDQIKKYIPKKSKVVDLGCGYAPYAELFNEFEYVGVDISKEMIDIARLKYPNLKFEQANMESYDIKSDVAISFLDGINYLTDNVQMSSFFKTLNKNINQNGVVALDIHDINKVQKFDDYYYYEESDDEIFRWESKIIDKYLIHFLIIEKFENGEIYMVEKHIQRLWNVDEIKQQALKHNFQLLDQKKIYDHDLLIFKKEKNEKIITN